MPGRAPAELANVHSHSLRKLPNGVADGVDGAFGVVEGTDQPFLGVQRSRLEQRDLALQLDHPQPSELLVGRDPFELRECLPQLLLDRQWNPRHVHAGPAAAEPQRLQRVNERAHQGIVGGGARLVVDVDLPRPALLPDSLGPVERADDHRLPAHGLEGDGPAVRDFRREGQGRAGHVGEVVVAEDDQHVHT